MKLLRIKKQKIAWLEGKGDAPPGQYKLAAREVPHRREGRHHSVQVAVVRVIRGSEILCEVDRRERGVPEPAARSFLHFCPLDRINISQVLLVKFVHEFN